MGQVLELKQRISGDWTVVERVHLDQLVSMLPAALAEDIEFGISDTGDPWCAVMNGEGEVVLHVARIAGRFFVHSTVEPFVADSHDLPTAIAPFVGDSFLERRHVASITPLYGLVMPLHAYAPPGSTLDQPGGDWLADAPAVAPTAEDTPQLPDTPEVWTAPVFQLAAASDAARFEPASEAEVIAFPLQETDWPAPMSGELLSFSAVARMEAVADIERADVSFEPFFQLPQSAPADEIFVQAPEAGEDDVTGQTSGVAGPGGAPPASVGGGNVVNVDFGQSTAGGGAGFAAPQTGMGLANGLERAAAGQELVISDLDPGIIVAWTDEPTRLMGVTPVAEAF